MENNEICMIMDIKLDVHDKIKFKQWTRCQVKIEAVKCLPCFLRVSFTPKTILEDPEAIEPKSTSISINVPGVTVSLASSRTREYSYGMFWTQSRRTCFIYYALETEIKCRRLMKWMKKSIKNLELHRQIVLEQRRSSRGNFPTRNVPKYLLPPQSMDEFDSASSYTSGIYEEIYDNDNNDDESATNVENYKRNKSRVSIASGIYEEMKPFCSTTINSKTKEDVAPPLPPLPPHRKRINTFETEVVSQLGNIPRSNTNPESDAIKKKKYKNMFDNIFGVSRTKRAESVSETQACSIEDIINCQTPQKSDTIANKQETIRKKGKRLNSKEKRNSFSSPDLSKINFMHYDNDDHDNDGKSTVIVKNTFSISRDFMTPAKPKTNHPQLRRDSLNSLNISSQIPNNFNFSACNNSKINLMGAHGAVQCENMGIYKNTKMQIDDFSGYCFMAPINMKSEIVESESPINAVNIEIHVENTSQNSLATNKTEDSSIYINMNNFSNSSNASPSNVQQFNRNLYENILTVKAAQELETLSVMNCAKQMSTSTPTECVEDSPQSINRNLAEEENFYQTPRKSIISIDEKIPSYYPNYVSDYSRNRRLSRSPLKERIMSSAELTDDETTTNQHDSNMKNSSKAHHKNKNNNYIKNSQELKPCKLPAKRNKVSNIIKTTAAQKISENVYAVSRIGKNIENNNNNNNNTKCNNNNKKKDKFIENDAVVVEEKNIPKELKHLAILPKIDFKFDDVRSLVMQESSADNETLLRSATTSTKTVALGRKIRASSHTPQKQQYEDMNTANNITPHTPPINTTNSIGYGGQLLQLSGMKKFASLPRLKKFDFSPLRLKINNVLQRHQPQQQQLMKATPSVAEIQE